MTYPHPRTGKRATRHFEKDSEARKFATEMGQEAADPGFHVTPVERVWLARYRQLADKAGLTMDEALKRLEQGNGSLVLKPVLLDSLIEWFLCFLCIQHQGP